MTPEATFLAAATALEDSIEFFRATAAGAKRLTLDDRVAALELLDQVHRLLDLIDGTQPPTEDEAPSASLVCADSARGFAWLHALQRRGGKGGTR